MDKCRFLLAQVQLCTLTYINTTLPRRQSIQDGPHTQMGATT